jgi:alpha-beta hydrolase superfamily lysophospholipase
MGAHIDDLPLAAVVAVSPSCVSWTAMGDNGTMPGVPSWTVGGDPVAHLDVADRVLMDRAMRDALRDRGRRNPLRPHVLHLARAYGTALDDAKGAAAAAIPVERIAAPLLLLSGSDDAVWPSGPMAETILGRRRDSNAAERDTHQHYDGAGHLLRLGCLPTDVTETSGIALGGTREGIAAAQADATTRVIEFFRTTL